MNPELQYFSRLLRWDNWANGETLESLRSGRAPDQVIRWMAHIVGAECLWLARLRHEAPTIPVWPEFDLDDSAVRIPLLAVAWQRYLEALETEDLDDGVAYRNSKGEFWTSSVRDILDHVVTHSAYHRGQIAAAVREAGGEPAYTDFIHAVRQGLVE